MWHTVYPIKKKYNEDQKQISLDELINCAIQSGKIQLSDKLKLEMIKDEKIKISELQKILLSILILFSFGIAAQTRMPISSFGDYESNITDKNLFDYAKKCYNDSAVRYYCVVCDVGCVEIPCEKGKKDYFGRTCPAHWSHRKPTLEGFIEFVHKKY